MNTITSTNEELEILEALRAHRRRHRKDFPRKISSHVESHLPELTTGQKISDVVAQTVGSWKFIIIQSACIFTWICYNSMNNQNA